MTEYTVTLESEPSRTFRCQKAANSVDLDVEKKLRHEFSIEADIESPYNVGLIVGASGSGKTTLAREIYGPESLQRVLDLTRPIIDQFPDDYTYDDCAALLCGVGLSAVPCWIRPAGSLSNGQRERAEIALQMSRGAEVVVIDEWTSVVDRTVGKVMSHCIQRWARKNDRRVVLASCHYDVIEWLQPDWIIDCNKAHFEDRRCLQRSRTEQLRFDIRECDKSAWAYFAKYHYLSERLPPCLIRTFGLFHGDDQIGFECFANYVPYRKEDQVMGRPMKMHSNRAVIHPDYVGMGLGLKMIDACSEIMHREGYEVHAKFSSIPLLKARMKSDAWRFKGQQRRHKVVVGGNMSRETGFRLDVTSYQFVYVPESERAH